MNKSIRNSNTFVIRKGFTLLEVIIALFVLTLGVLGGIFVIQQTIILTAHSSARITAIYLAQEGMEIVRNIRDTNWLEEEDWRKGLGDGQWQADFTHQQGLNPYDGRFLNIDERGFYSYFSGHPTKFQRKIILTSPGLNILNVRVEVYWTERGRPYSLSVQGNLYNWY